MDRLTPAEEQVMLRLWKLEKGSVKDIVELYVHTDEIRGREERFVDNYEEPLENFIDVNTSGITPYESYQNIIKKLNI